MKIRENASTIVLAITVLLSVLSKGSFVWITAGILFPPWALYSFIRIIKYPSERRSRSIRLAIWIVTIAILLVAADHWDSAAEHEADSVASAVVAYKTRTGAYPGELSEVGIDAQLLRDEYRIYYYVNENGMPGLSYFRPSMPLFLYRYNFERRTWHLRG